MESRINASALKNPWFYISIIGVIIIIALIYNGIKTSDFAETIKDSQIETVFVEVNEDDDAILGDPNAPVTIIEFSDYECPFCGKHFLQTFPLLKEKYIDTGKAKLIFRDFPLISIHPNAQKIAEAAECAGEQGEYYKMHDKIFENQQPTNVNDLKDYAIEIGLNENEFNVCLDSGQMAEEVQLDLQDGQKAGVRGTPSFFINGRHLSGTQPFGVFKQIIEEELK